MSDRSGYLGWDVLLAPRGIDATQADALEYITSICAHRYPQGMRTSVIFDDELAAEARELGINVSEAAREGLRQAIRRRRAERDRAAYRAHPETEDPDWDEAESWGEA